MIIPEKLKKDNKIGIISTARKISIEELEPAIKLLNSWGLEVILSKNLFNQKNQFSGSKSERTADLQDMLDDKSIKAIFCARGGYGTVQIIDDINFERFKRNPKWIIGYSDVTVLHSHIHNLGIATMHATMPINFIANTAESLDSLKNCLFDDDYTIKCNVHELNSYGKVESEIIGGNLSILYSLLGSDSDINTDGKILFIEDLDEYLYHIDRMMINLKRNRKFDKLSGLIVGGMQKLHDNIIPFGKTAEEIICSYLEDYNFPICFCFPSGHIDDNRSIKFGVKSTLEIDENGVNLSQ
tara:strand:+ start:52152 stop:53045 length:894 start_codon:yes stop_codon:yes gene_type:complete